MFSRIHASASTKSIILSRIAFGSSRIARASPAYRRLARVTLAYRSRNARLSFAHRSRIVDRPRRTPTDCE